LLKTADTLNEKFPIVLIWFFIWMAFIILYVFSFVMWDFVRWGIGAFLALILAGICFAVKNYVRKGSRKDFLISAGVTVGISFVMVLVFFLFSGGCYADEPLELYFRVSHRDICKQFDICHVYLTVGEDVARNIIVHIHTHKNISGLTVYYDTSSYASASEYRYRVTPDTYYHTTISHFTDRYVHYAYLYDLQPNTTYYFVIGSQDTVIDDYGVRKFKTTYGEDDGIHFITGGDVGLFPNSQVLLNMTTLSEPAFLALGGDLAYGNGFPACYGRWDLWLETMVNNLISPNGNIIPVVTSIGNHEAGGFHKKANSEPFYSAYFVHQPLEGRSPFELKRYHAHYLGSHSMFLSLDSGVIEEIGGDQAAWIESQFQLHPERYNTMAMYHAGLYPSLRRPNKTLHVELRANWQPIFDKYNLKVAFENHDHGYKRTYPIRNNLVVPSGEGTIYMGDGALGVESRKPVRDEEHDWYLDEVSGDNHFLEIKLTNSTLTVLATNITNEVFDELELHTGQNPSN
jgi:hypothetical protein